MYYPTLCKYLLMCLSQNNKVALLFVALQCCFTIILVYYVYLQNLLRV